MAADYPLKVGTTTLTTDAAVLTGKGWYYGARIIGDGTNAAAVTIYDNTAASGTVIDALRCALGDCNGDQFTRPVRVDTGIYLDVTTVGRVIVWFES